MNPKAGENSSGAFRREGQRRKAKTRRSEVPAGLKPRSSRGLARAASVLSGRPESPYLGAAARSGGEGAAPGPSPGEARGGQGA